MITEIQTKRTESQITHKRVPNLTIQLESGCESLEERTGEGEHSDGSLDGGSGDVIRALRTLLLLMMSIFPLNDPCLRVASQD